MRELRWLRLCPQHERIAQALTRQGWPAVGTTELYGQTTVVLEAPREIEIEFDRAWKPFDA